MATEECTPNGGLMSNYSRHDLKRAAVDAIVASTLLVSAVALLAITGIL